MAVKTITIDLEAYELLARRKKPGQSFSQVIKQTFAGTRTGAELLEAASDARLSDDVLDAVDSIVMRRRGDLAKAPRL